MRVGMICPYSLSVDGGVQEQVLGLARVLRQRGVDVRVLAPCDGPPPDAGITSLGASLPTAANGSIAPIAPDMPAQVRLIKALWNEEFDVLHLHEPLAPGIGITTVLMQAAPMVGTFHAAGRSSAYRWVNRGCRALRSRLSIACAVSAEAEALASQWLGGSYERVFNGIDVHRYAAAEPVAREGPTVLFVGRHEERKGLRVLLQAAEQLPADVRIWVGGDGDETLALKREFRGNSRVEWLGRLSDQEKLSRLAGASVFCAPSLGGESFGIVLLEAMSAGTPIVASDITGYSLVARGGSDALMVEPANPDALAGALRTALASGPEVQQRVERGSERAAEFSMETLADVYSDMYERALIQG
ncbi:MAG: glycosyltransferase family 4 protein [Acidimicrobiales bacterium]|jgi:phosphatidylinositol alpha-mannosyltransferase